MKVAIIGGHFTPALAVIESLPKNTEVIYIGRKYVFEKDKTVSLEYSTVQRLGIPFISLTTGRVQRSFTFQTIPSLLKIPYGFFQALAILRKNRPDVIVGFGGYLSIPVCYAAKLLGIPIVIHEQTLETGLANKIIGRFATTICISWESSEKFFPTNRTVLTGNPLLNFKFQISNFKFTEEKNVPFVCIIGGSSGSHAINMLVEGCLPQLLEKYVVIHQTGDAQEFRDYDRLITMKETLPEKLRKRYTIIKYIEPEQFLSVLEKSDLVVSRSGINTITILLFLKKISLLIPLPFSQRNEQYKNASLVKNAGFGEIIDQQSVNPQEFFDKIAFMFNNKKSYEKKTAQIKEADPFSASQKIVKVITKLYQENTKTKD